MPRSHRTGAGSPFSPTNRDATRSLSEHFPTSRTTEEESQQRVERAQRGPERATSFSTIRHQGKCGRFHFPIQEKLVLPGWLWTDNISRPSLVVHTTWLRTDGS